MSVALSAAVAEVSITLRTCHMITSLCPLDVDLQREAKKDGKIKITIFPPPPHKQMKLVKSCLNHESFQPRKYVESVLFSSWKVEMSWWPSMEALDRNCFHCCRSVLLNYPGYLPGCSHFVSRSSSALASVSTDMKHHQRSDNRLETCTAGSSSRSNNSNQLPTGRVPHFTQDMGKIKKTA